MAALFLNFNRITLDTSIEEARNTYRSIMDATQFKDIIITPGEVAGNFAETFTGKRTARLSVTLLPIGGNDFWRVASIGGDNTEETREALNRFVSELPFRTGGDPNVKVL